MDEDDDTLDGYRPEIFFVQRPKAYLRAMARSVAIHSTSLLTGSP